MKRYGIAIAILAALVALSPIAAADEYNPPVSSQPVSFEGSILEVIASEALMEETSTPEPSGSVPLAENLELETYRGIAIGGKLSANDPDGGELHFTISTEPVKGSVSLSSNGYFVYCPQEGKKGKDYFAYYVTDEEGNRSQDATVIIKLQARQSKVCYSDLDGEGCAYSAALLADRGVFIGEQLGEDYVFSPDKTVSRGEFLSMCMVLSGQEPVQGVLTTGYLDDESTAGWLKPYISTALMEGYISGEGTGEALFEAEAAITLADACDVLNAVAGLSDVVSVSTLGGESQSVANLTACGILDSAADMSRELTRREAAELLAGVIRVLDQR